MIILYQGKDQAKRSQLGDLDALKGHKKKLAATKDPFVIEWPEKNVREELENADELDRWIRGG